MTSRRQAFEVELSKLGALAPAPVLQQGLRMPRVPAARSVGTFGIADNYKKVAATVSQNDPSYETPTKARWARTLKDVPLSVGAMGVGYGIGRLAAEAALSQVANHPKALANLPNVVGVAGGLTGIGLVGLRSFLKRRRDDAELAARKKP